jgi:aspartyl protease family protein
VLDYCQGMSARHPLRTLLMLLLIISCAGGARSHLGSVMDALAPVRAAEAHIVSRAPAISAAPIPHTVRRDPDGLFYVQALVNGKPVRFLVDTGASVVVLTAADARAVGARVEDEQFTQKVNTVGGSTQMAWTTIQSLRLAGRDVRGLRAGIVKEGLGVSLLGQNMLTQLELLTISAEGLSMR